MIRPDPDGLLNLGLMVILALLGMTVSVATVRVFFGPTLPDRVIALDLVAFAAVAMIGAYAIATDRGTLLDVALVLSLLMFLGTVAFARFFEQRASGRKPSP